MTLKPIMSGHCSFPQTANPSESHDRCAGLQYNNAQKGYHPCPCGCHLGEEFDCAMCGRLIREAPLMEDEGYPGEMVYVHVDKDGRAIGEECPPGGTPPPKPEPEVSEPSDTKPKKKKGKKKKGKKKGKKP